MTFNFSTPKNFHSTLKSLIPCALLVCVAGLAHPPKAHADEAAPVATASATRSESFAGRAFDKKGKTLLYTEKHTRNFTAGKLTHTKTRYVDPAGNVIAVLKADYSKSPFAPDYTFTDKRHNWKRSARIQGSQVEFSINSKTKRVKRPKLSSFVLSQGFHSFIVANFSAIAAGKTIKLKYGIPAKFEIYDFRLRKSKDLGQGRIRIKIEVDSWLARRFAPDLQVDYDIATKRLVRYKGLSNILDDDGDEQDVVIRYRYP